MTKTIATLLVLATFLGGCLGDGDPSTDSPRAEVEGNATPPEPWILHGVSCTTDVFQFQGERGGVESYVPEALHTGGSTPTVFVYFLVHACDALVERNTSFAKDVHLATVFVAVDDPDHELPRYLLEVLTDWPQLADTFAATGTPTHLVDVVRDQDATFLRLEGESVSYRFDGVAASVFNPATPFTYAMYAGATGEHLLHYSYLLEQATDAPSGMALQADGGVLSEVLPGSTTVAQHGIGVADLRITDSKQGIHLPQR